MIEKREWVQLSFVDRNLQVLEEPLICFAGTILGDFCTSASYKIDHLTGRSIDEANPMQYFYNLDKVDVELNLHSSFPADGQTLAEVCRECPIYRKNQEVSNIRSYDRLLSCDGMKLLPKRRGGGYIGWHSILAVPRILGQTIEGVAGRLDFYSKGLASKHGGRKIFDF